MEETYRHSVALQAKDRDIVSKFGEKMGLDFSSSLRVIIREWAAQSGFEIVSIDTLPGPEDAEHPPLITIAPKSE